MPKLFKNFSKTVGSVPGTVNESATTVEEAIEKLLLDQAQEDPTFFTQKIFEMILPEIAPMDINGPKEAMESAAEVWRSL